MNLAHYEDLGLTRNLSAEAAARASFLRSNTAKNVLFGSAALAVGLGIGAAALLWAHNQKLDPEVLKTALEQMPTLKVEGIVKADGEVTMKDGLVTMKDGNVVMKDGTVVLKDGATVDIDPNATVQVEGGTNTGPTSKLPGGGGSGPKTTADGEAIKRTVTVFNSVVHAQGHVISGWDYADGKGKKPIHQFCYYRNGDTAIDFADDRKMIQSQLNKVPQPEAAKNKCQWF